MPLVAKPLSARRTGRVNPCSVARSFTRSDVAGTPLRCDGELCTALRSKPRPMAPRDTERPRDERRAVACAISRTVAMIPRAASALDYAARATYRAIRILDQVRSSPDCESTAASGSSGWPSMFPLALRTAASRRPDSRSSATPFAYSGARCRRRPATCTPCA